MSNEVKVLDAIPMEVRKQIPIFQFLGDQLPAAVKSPEGKKTVGKVLFWTISAAFIYFFVTNITNLLTLMKDIMLFGIFAVVIFLGAYFSPQIISQLQRIGDIQLFKWKRNIIRNNPIENLRLLLNEAKETMQKVVSKITQVEGTRNDMMTSAETNKTIWEEKTKMVKKLSEKAKELDAEAAKYDEKGQTETANAKRREAKTTRNSAQINMAEAQSAEVLTRQYTQYANQFSKIVEVLKDNRVGVQMYFDSLKASINIIESKMEATGKMRSATEGLAEIFNIKDNEVFDIAIRAATEQINFNIASVKNNLEFVAQNQTIAIGGNVNQADLDAFVSKMESGSLTKLNISEMADASYELKNDERPDKTFDFFKS